MLELANSCEIGQLHQFLVSKHFTIPYLTYSFAVKFCEMDESCWNMEEPRYGEGRWGAAPLASRIFGKFLKNLLLSAILGLPVVPKNIRM